MTIKELQKQIDDGVNFYCYVDNDIISGVMGIQDKQVVNLIRHAYVRTSMRRNGLGSILLKELVGSSMKPILIGTWKDAHWAISFYQKNGFHLLIIGFSG